MTILRIYDPTECNDHGVLLDWDRCRACEGTGRARALVTTDPAEVRDACKTCAGRGSLKAAALHGRLGPLIGWRHEDASRLRVGVELRAACSPTKIIRCEACYHPMSEGTWKPDFVLDSEERRSLLRRIASNFSVSAESGSVHYSPCDEGCKHGGPARYRPTGIDDACGWNVVNNVATYSSRDERGAGVNALIVGYQMEVEASWRQVDVRCLGWDHDLRPEKLSVLCLRCYAERTS